MNQTSRGGWWACGVWGLCFEVGPESGELPRFIRRKVLAFLQSQESGLGILTMFWGYLWTDPEQARLGPP